MISLLQDNPINFTIHQSQLIRLIFPPKTMMESWQKFFLDEGVRTPTGCPFIDFWLAGRFHCFHHVGKLQAKEPGIYPRL